MDDFGMYGDSSPSGGEGGGDTDLDLGYEPADDMEAQLLAYGSGGDEDHLFGEEDSSDMDDDDSDDDEDVDDMFGDGSPHGMGFLHSSPEQPLMGFTGGLGGNTGPHASTPLHDTPIARAASLPLHMSCVDLTVSRRALRSRRQVVLPLLATSLGRMNGLWETSHRVDWSPQSRVQHKSLDEGGEGIDASRVCATLPLGMNRLLQLLSKLHTTFSGGEDAGSAPLCAPHLFVNQRIAASVNWQLQVCLCVYMRCVARRLCRLMCVCLCMCV